MRKLFLLLIICGLITSCSEEPEPLNGYFKRYYAHGYNYDSEYPFLVHINNDTMVQYFVLDQKLDSTTYLWNNIDSTYFKLGGNIRMGSGYNRPAYAVNNDKVVLKIDTTGFAKKLKDLVKDRKTRNKTAEEVLLDWYVVEARKGSTMTDTLFRLSKGQFLNEIKEQKLKDSIAFFHPYISDFFAAEQIRTYISFYMEDKGDFIPHSLEIRRQADDIFHGKFNIKKTDYFSTIETYIYEFNFEGNQMKAKRIN